MCTSKVGIIRVYVTYVCVAAWLIVLHVDATNAEKLTLYLKDPCCHGVGLHCHLFIKFIVTTESEVR